MRRGHDRSAGQQSGTASTGMGDPSSTGATSAGEYQQSGQHAQQGSSATGQDYPSERVDYGRDTGQAYPSQPTEYGPAQGPRVGARPYGEEEYRGPGSREVVEPRRRLAAALLILSGLVTFFSGITGVISGLFYGHVANFPFYFSVRSRGILELIIGAVVFMVGVCLMLGMHWARYLAIVVAVVSAIANFMFLPYYPFWSVIVIALDIFIIWACAYPSPRRREYA
jgi:hypothetical protein